MRTIQQMFTASDASLQHQGDEHRFLANVTVIHMMYLGRGQQPTMDFPLRTAANKSSGKEIS